jgi:hypothetical protein
VDNAKPRRDGLGQGAQLHLQFLQASVPGGCPGWVNTGDSLPRPPLLPMAPSAITTDKGSSYWQRCGTFAKFPPDIRFAALLR